MDVRESSETINGCRIRLMRGGSGPPLLFLHDASGAGNWAPFMAALARHHDVIVPEHPGFGGSDTPAWLDNVGDLAYFYLDLLDAFDLNRVHLVGTSIGGWIAAELAVRSTTRLASLVLSAPAGIHIRGLKKGDIFLWSREESLRNLFHDQALAEAAIDNEPTEDEQVTQMKNRLIMAKLAWQPRLYNPDLIKWLHRINVPTLILWGDDDKVIPPGYGPAFAKAIPGARLETIAKSGHLPQIEQSDQWAGRVVAFTAGVVS